jgi:hypothetical protein
MCIVGYLLKLLLLFYIYIFFPFANLFEDCKNQANLEKLLVTILAIQPTRISRQRCVIQIYPVFKSFSIWSAPDRITFQSFHKFCSDSGTARVNFAFTSCSYSLGTTEPFILWCSSAASRGQRKVD